MGGKVYANGMGISCKAGSGKVIAAMPDVCLSPPSPPAGPVPIPYPVSSSSSDTTGGSKSVKVGGDEAMLKDKSSFKKCSGDEAATKSLGQGVVTHTIGGKVYFVAWSMDVEFEGENVVRHLDMTTSNHASPLGNQTAPWAEIDDMFVTGGGGPCDGIDTALKLQPYKPNKCPSSGGKKQTGHHLIPGRCCKGRKGYNHSKAPVICVTGRTQHKARHRACHAAFDPVELKHSKAPPFRYKHARAAAIDSVGKAFNPPRTLTPDEAECMKAQFDAYYKAKPDDGPGYTENEAMIASGAKGKVIPRTAPGITT